MWTLYHKILHEKKNSPKKIWGPGSGQNPKKLEIFSEKRDFRNKNAQKIGENIFCQQQTLFLDRIHWFMHKNQV